MSPIYNGGMMYDDGGGGPTDPTVVSDLASTGTGTGTGTQTGAPPYFPPPYFTTLWSGPINNQPPPPPSTGPYFPPPYFSALWGGGGTTTPKTCPDGYQLDASGNCVKTTKTCPTGYKLDASGNCVPIPKTCPSGFKLDAAGNCVPISQPPYFPYVPPYVPPTPPYVSPYVPPYVAPVKTATPQYVLFNDDEVPVDAIVDLLFENVGGQELLAISRHDTVLGQNILYQPIKNLNILKEEYNPNNLVRLQQTSDKFFANYTIKLSDKIPVVGNGANGDNVYLDSDGNLIVEFINLNSDEQIEIQITTNGTIYEAGI